MRWWIASLIAVMAISVGAQSDAPPVLRVSEQCTPNPQMMPFWVMMAQTDGELDGAIIEYVPVTGPPQRMALALNDGFDVTLAFVFEWANMVTAGEVETLRIETVSVWRSFALVASPDVDEWGDLVGETVLLPQRGRGGDVITRLSMRNAGYDPYTDFDIQHLPLGSMVPLLVSGDASAAALGGPTVYSIINSAAENGVTLGRADIDLLDGASDSELWDAGTYPQGALIVQQAVLDDPDMFAAYEAFNVAYHEAAQFALDNPDEAAALIAEQVGKVCGSRVNPAPIAAALADGYIIYDPQPAADLMPDLAETIAAITEKPIDDALYLTTER